MCRDNCRRSNERVSIPLRWRHSGHDGVSNLQVHHCLLNRLFRRRSKITSKVRVTGLCVGNSPVTGEIPAQMASIAENVSICWRHHAIYMNAGTNDWITRHWLFMEFMSTTSEVLKYFYGNHPMDCERSSCEKINRFDICCGNTAIDSVITVIRHPQSGRVMMRWIFCKMLKIYRQTSYIRRTKFQN